MSDTIFTDREERRIITATPSSQKANDETQAKMRSPFQRLQNNLTVLDALRKNQNVDVSLYSGFGGINDIMKPPAQLKGATRDCVESLHEICSDLDKKYQKPAGTFLHDFKSNVLTAYYTPENIITPVYEALKPYFKPTSFLDPSAGMGAFYKAMPEAWKNSIRRDKLRMVELDAATSLLLQKKYGEDVVKGISFEHFNSMKDFDLVASNVPFGDMKVYDEAYPAMDIHSYFIVKSMDLTKDGGIGIFMTSLGFMDSKKNETIRTALLDKNTLLGAYRLPNTTFKSSHTSACADLIILQKGRTYDKTPLEQAFCNDYATLTGSDGTKEDNYNGYYAQKPESLLGEPLLDGLYGRDSFDLVNTGNLVAELNSQLSTMVHPRAVVTQQTQQQRKMQTPVQQLSLFNSFPAVNSEKTVNVHSTRRVSDEVMKGFLMRCVSKNGTASVTDIARLSGLSNKECFSAIKPFVFFDPSIQRVVLRDTYLHSENPQKRIDDIYQYIRNRSTPLTLVQKEVFQENIDALKALLPFNLGDMSRYGLSNLTPDTAESYFKVLGAQGSLWVRGNELGHIKTDKIDGKMQYSFQPLPAQQNFASIREYVALKRTYLLLNHLDRENHPEAGRIRTVFNKEYDNFVVRHGVLNGSNPLLEQINELDTNFAVMTGLELRNGESWEKTDVFRKNTIYVDIKTMETEISKKPLADILLFVYDRKMSVDLDYTAELAKRKNPKATKGSCFRELNEQGLIFYEPVEKKYVLREEYLCGDIKQKIRIAKNEIDYIKSSDKNEMTKENQITALKSNIAELEKVLPTSLKANEINFALGQRWIPTEIYSQYANYIREQLYPDEVGSWNTPIEITYSKELDEYVVKNSDRLHDIIPFSRHPFNKILVATMNDATMMTISRTVEENGVKKTFIDKHKTDEINKLQRDLHKGFQTWIENDPELSSQLANRYNDLYNREIERSYGNYLHFNTQRLNPTVYQKNAAAQMLHNKGGYLAHCVGSGKTLTMAMVAHKGKELNYFQKPLLICLKANIGSIEEEFRKAYPTARILVADSKNFKPVNRARFFANAANSDWDCIIMTHENYRRIPHTKEIQLKFISEEIKELNDVSAKLDERYDAAHLKRLQKRTDKLTGQLTRLNQKIARNQDNGLCFENLGIDFLMVDEADIFKNLGFATQLQIAGLPNSASDRAQNLLYGVRHIQEIQNGKGVLFASGTPVSNSVAELYLIFKYLMPEKLEALNLKSFDAFQKLYITVETDLEFSVTGELRQKNRMSKYNNVPELSRLNRQIANVYTSDEHRQNTNVKIPAEHRDLISVPASTLQKEATAAVQLVVNDNIENWDYLGLPEYTFKVTRNGEEKEIPAQGQMEDQQKTAKMLLACNLTNKIAVDMHLLIPYLNEVSPKIQAVVENVFHDYCRFKEEKGTQLVFCDVGVPGNETFNLYQHIKDLLVEKGVPENEIVFMQNYKTDAKKQKMYADFRAGKIRVLIGSTPTMGAGVNVQDKVIAMHHVDCPWRPRDLIQRVGRGIRQGNELGIKHGTKNLFYAVEESLDKYKYNLVSIKESFINQIMSNTLPVRDVSSEVFGQDDNDNLMTYKEMVAKMTGDNRLSDLAKLERSINLLSLDRKHFLDKKNAAQREIETLGKEINDIAGNIDKRKKDISAANEVHEYLKNNNVTSCLTLSNGKIITGSKEIGHELKQIIYKKAQSESIGHVPKPLNVNVGQFEVGVVTYITEKHTQDYRIVLMGLPTQNRTSGITNRTTYYGGVRSYITADDAQLGLSLIDMANACIRQATDLEQKIDKKESKIKGLQSSLQETFDDSVLNVKIEQLEALKADLTANPPRDSLIEIKERIEYLVRNATMSEPYRLGQVTMEMEPNSIPMPRLSETKMSPVNKKAEKIIQVGKEKGNNQNNRLNI
jgi:N12 class adenine-specific DNA methylase